MFGGLTIYLPVANFLQCISAKNYASWLAVEKVVAVVERMLFLDHRVVHSQSVGVFCILFKNDVKMT